MLQDYIRAAMETAKYEIIKDEEPFYGRVPSLKGVWASGKTLEACRKSLEEALEGWLMVRIRRGLSIPQIKGRSVEIPAKVRAYG